MCVTSLVGPSQLRNMFFFILLLAIGWAILPWETIPDCQTIQTAVKGTGVWGPVAYVLLYIVATLFFIPGVPVSLSGGVAFGPGYGFLLVTIGSNLGALAAFVISKRIARERVQRFLGKYRWYLKFTQGFQKHSFLYLLSLRLSAVFPFNGLNYACGLLPITVREYLWSTFIGMLPGSFVFVYLGNYAGCTALQKGEVPTEQWIALGMGCLVLTILSLLPIGLKSKW